MKKFYDDNPDHKLKLSSIAKLLNSSRVNTKVNPEKAKEWGVRARKFIQTPHGVARGVEEAIKISGLSKSSILRRLNNNCDGWYRLGESNSPSKAPQTFVLPLN